VDRRLVVEVRGERTGSGLLLADRLVLTAAHLLHPAGAERADEQEAREPVVRLAEGGHEYAARCAWARYADPESGLDAALLEITSPDWQPLPVTAVRPGRLTGSARIKVHAFGFPDAAVYAKVAELSPVTGSVHTESGILSGRPDIVVDGEPVRGPDGKSLWAGLSGGPVFAAPDDVTSDVLLGIIVGDPAAFASRRLRMIPVHAILDDSAAARIAHHHCGNLAVIAYPPARPYTRLSAPPGVRFSLPPDTAAFTGRDEELDRIAAAAADTAQAGGVVAVGAIDGMPGVGKTALAVHIAHLLTDKFPDRQLFVNLHAHTPGREPVTPQDALAGLLAADGVDARFVPRDLDARAGMWRDRMAGQRALLVLDNAASSTQVISLLPGGDCLVLVTSRRHLGDLPGAVTAVLLDVLPPDQAAEMFTRLAPRAAADPGGVAAVVELAGFLPLAVSLLARVYARHSSWTLANLAAETRDSGLALSAENNTIAAAFDVSYRHLDPALRRLFDLLGLHPGTTADQYAAAALAGTSPAEAGPMLDGLHREGLLTETGHRRYGMHDLLRRYAHDHAAARPGRKKAIRRLLAYYLSTARTADQRLTPQPRDAVPAQPGAPAASLPDLPSRESALGWMEAERLNLSAVVAYAQRHGQPRHAIGTAHAMHTYLRGQGHWSQARELHAVALTAARQLGDRLEEATALVDLAAAQRLTGDPDAALDSLRQAADLYRGHGDRPGLARALNALGFQQRTTGDYPDAAASLDEALRLCRDLGDEPGEATVLNNLGAVHNETANYPQAEASFTRGLELCRASGDRHGQANALNGLATMQYITGREQEGTATLGRALELYHSLGDKLGEATVLSNLAQVDLMADDCSAASTRLTRALDLCRDLGDQLGQANALNVLGELQVRDGDYGTAIATQARALDLYQDLHDRKGQARALASLGVAQQAAGHSQAAEASLRQALKLFRDLGDQHGQAEVLNNAGDLALSQGSTATATGFFNEALIIATAITAHAEEARARDGLSRCHLS
jgi:tetratricopeptide (TPR) repeat protein